MSGSKRAIKVDSSKKIKGLFIRSQIIFLFIYILTFITASFFSAKLDVAADSVYYISVVIVAVVSLFIGLFSGYRTRKKGMITGIIFSLPINLLIVFISMIFNGFNCDFTAILTPFIAIISAGIGGIISVNAKVSK